MCAGGRLAAAEVDELLSSLVDKSLLQPVADGTRLRMLETIREFGAEKLAGRGEVGELRRRHAAHYSALMSEAAPRLLTRDQLSWLAALRADRDNILAALRYWCDAEDAGERAAAWRCRSASWRCCSATSRTWRSGPARPSRCPGRRTRACGPSPRRCTW